MEKFYIVDADSTLGKAYQNYKTDSDLLYKTYLDFAKEKGITSDGVYLTAKRLWINPTAEDREKFGAEFMMYEPGKFKKTSQLCKEWVNLCKEKGIRGLSKPNPIFYFHNFFNVFICNDWKLIIIIFNSCFYILFTDSVISDGISPCYRSCMPKYI